MKENLEEGQIVLCTVDRIVGTIVFVKIEGYNLEGTITFSEISPGRIRNIREYAFPGKKIVCKILSIRQQGIYLSLRRVKLKEKTELNERLKLEKSYNSVFKAVLGEKTNNVLKEIEEYTSLIDLVEEAKNSPKLLEKYLSKEEAEKIISIINERKIKDKILQKRFSLSSKNSNGITLIKTIITQARGNAEAEVIYLGAGKYDIKMKSKDLKQADNTLKNIIETIEKSAKTQNLQFLAEKL